jgi:hypothetical protein
MIMRKIVLAMMNTLKAEPAGDIHLSGGATLAQTLVRLGLVLQGAASRVHNVLPGRRDVRRGTLSPVLPDLLATLWA